MIDADKLAAAREALDRDGFVVLRRALDALWVEQNRAALRAYVEPYLGDVGAESRAIGASALAPAVNLSGAPRDVAAFVADPRLGAAAAALLGVKAVRLLHFCGFFKPPLGSPTPWRRDMDVNPHDSDRIITAWLPLVPVNAPMGLLSFASGSHRQEGAVTADGYPIVATGPLRPGDVSFHLAGTLHSAAANTTGRMCEAMSVSFYAAGAGIDDERGARFCTALREQHVANLAPGNVASGAANPIAMEQDR